MVAISLVACVIGCFAVFAWWDIAKRRESSKSEAGDISKRLESAENRIAQLEEHDKNNRSQIAGIKNFALPRRR